MKTNLLVCALLVLFGMLAHFVWRLYLVEQAGTILSPRTYIAQHPYGVLVAVLGGYLLFALMYFMGQLNEAISIGIGVLCNEAFDMLRARAAGRLREAGLSATDDAGQQSGV